MKNAISNVWLLGLVALFIFIFAGYLAITLNYTKTFKVKNEVLTIIEKQKGLYDHQGTSRQSIIGGGTVTADVGSLQIVSLYLYGSGYKAKGACDIVSATNSGGEKWYGVSNLGIKDSANQPIIPEIVEINASNANDRYYYCFSHGVNRKHDKNNNALTESSHYYKVQLFYKMDFPVIGDLFTFRVEGTTTQINLPCCGNNAYCNACIYPEA